MLIIVISLLLEKKYSSSKSTINPTQFCLGSISNGLRATESSKLSLDGNLYDFSFN